MWDKRRGTGRVLLVTGEKVWQKLRGHENGASPEGNGEAPGKSVALLFCSDVLGCDYVDAGATDICENNVSNVYWCRHIYNL